jgi:type I restriction enzyme S subunit
MSSKATAGVTTFRFDQMATLINDRVDNPAESGVERYVGLEHLDADSLRIRRWGEITDVESTKLRFQPGDIIFGKRRVYQRKLAVADFEGICSAHAMVLRAKENVVLPEFLPFFMQSDRFMERALAISVGSLSPTINWTTLAAEEFALLPIEEQRRIVEVLQAAGASSESYLRLSDCVVQARLALVFEFESRIPDDRMTTLGEVTHGLQAGASPASPGHEATEDEHGVLKVSAVGDWEYVETENKAISADAFVSALEVKVGDFLVTRANADPDSVGRTCIVRNTRSGLMLSDKTWRLRFHDDHSYDPHAVLAWTKSRSFRSHIRNHLNGTDAKNISQAWLLAGPIPKLDAAFIMFSERIAELSQSVSLLSTRLHQARELERRLLVEVLGR